MSAELTFAAERRGGAPVTTVLVKGPGWRIEHDVRRWTEDCGCDYEAHDLSLFVGATNLVNDTGATLEDAHSSLIAQLRPLVDGATAALLALALEVGK
jgi:hypothetical protein